MRESFPFFGHRTMAEVMRDEIATEPAVCPKCGDVFCSVVALKAHYAHHHKVERISAAAPRAIRPRGNSVSLRPTDPAADPFATRYVGKPPISGGAA